MYVSSFVGEFHRQQKSKMYISTPQLTFFFKWGSRKGHEVFQNQANSQVPEGICSNPQ